MEEYNILKSCFVHCAVVYYNCLQKNGISTSFFFMKFIIYFYDKFTQNLGVLQFSCASCLSRA